METIKQSSHKRGAETTLTRRYMNSFTDGKMPIHNGFEYFGLLLFSTGSTLYPLYSGVVNGINTAVDDSPFNVYGSVAGYNIFDVGLIAVGIGLLLMLSLGKRQYTSATLSLVQLPLILIRIIVVRVIVTSARVFMFTSFVVLSVSLFIAALINPIMHAGYQFFENNRDLPLKRIEIIEEQITQLKIRREDARGLGCLTIGTKDVQCLGITKSADAITKDIDAKSAEILAVMEEYKSSKGGGYALLVDIIRYFYPSVTDKQIAGARGLIVGFVCNMGTILAVPLFAFTYYPPLVESVCRRRARRDRDLPAAEYVQILAEEPRLSLGQASGFLLRQLTGRVADGLLKTGEKVRPAPGDASPELSQIRPDILNEGLYANEVDRSNEGPGASLKEADTTRESLKETLDQGGPFEVDPNVDPGPPGGSFEVDRGGSFSVDRGPSGGSFEVDRGPSGGSFGVDPNVDPHVDPAARPSLTKVDRGPSKVDPNAGTGGPLGVDRGGSFGVDRGGPSGVDPNVDPGPAGGSFEVDPNVDPGPAGGSFEVDPNVDRSTSRGPISVDPGPSCGPSKVDPNVDPGPEVGRIEVDRSTVRVPVPKHTPDEDPPKEEQPANVVYLKGASVPFVGKPGPAKDASDTAIAERVRTQCPNHASMDRAELKAEINRIGRTYRGTRLAPRQRGRLYSMFNLVE